MAKLILDLDLTVLVTKYDLDDLHEDHNISEYGLGVTLDIYHNKLYFEFINPDELSNLINVACEEHDGIIILTSGCWPKSILGLLVEYLDLSDKASDLVSNCIFHSAATDYYYFMHPGWSIKDEVNYTKALKKDIRLEKIIEHNPSLRGSHFVLLDDNIEHINAFDGVDNVTAVWAKTHIADKEFYQEALDSLVEAREKEAIDVPIASVKKENKNKIVHPNTLFGSSQKAPKRERDEFEDTDSQQKKQKPEDLTSNISLETFISK